MTTEEFQKYLVDDIKSIKSDIHDMKKDIGNLSEGQNRIEKKLDAVYDQTAILAEFRTEVNAKLDYLIEDNKSIH